MFSREVWQGWLCQQKKSSGLSNTCVVEFAGGVGKSHGGARPSLHGGAGEAGRKGRRGCVAQQLTLEGKWWPGVGLNPVTGLSKRCPPSLEEQGAEERVQP